MFPHLNLKLSLNLIILYFNFHHPTAANKTRPTKPTNPDKCFCELSNKLIHDTNCLCDVNQLINFNQNHVRPTMQKLMKTDYFRYFKTNVDKGCEYWDEPYVCTTNQCGLAPCTPTELPPILAADSEKGSSSQNKAKEDDFRDQVSEDQNLENKEESCSDQSNQENKYKILTSKLSELINSKSNSIHVNSILDDDITDIDVESNPIILTPTEVKDMQKHWDQHDEEQNKQNKAIWQKSFTHDDLVMNAEGNQQQDGNCKYYDLLKNPERYTGYGGPPAHRVWRKIYEENCYAEKEISTFTNPASNLPFGSMPGMQHLVEENKDKEWYRKPNEVIKELNCVEKRVFFRAVSGLHSSISLHLSYIWFFPEEGVFKPNLDEFIRRFENENGRVYIENLYFVWLMELRALAKATAYLTNPNNIREIVHTGDVLSDIKTQSIIIELTEAIKSFDVHFDESHLFRGHNAEEMMEDFRQRMFTVTKIVDCADCEKCRLWGKLQTTGLATAVKIILTPIECLEKNISIVDAENVNRDSDENIEACENFRMSRNEIVALFNAFARLSDSVGMIEDFKVMLKKKKRLEREAKEKEKVVRNEL